VKGLQAIMDQLLSLSVKGKGTLPTIPSDERAAEIPAINER
jgi:hypothetical protein